MRKRKEGVEKGRREKGGGEEEEKEKERSQRWCNDARRCINGGGGGVSEGEEWKIREARGRIRGEVVGDGNDEARHR